MDKEEWEKFWKYLLARAYDTDTYWLEQWLETEKEWYEDEKNKKRRSVRTLPDSMFEQEGKSKDWQCSRCGKCCTFIVIPVRDKIDMETEGYLDAHGIKCLDRKLIIPARCRFLRKNGKIYKCRIHNSKFANCRLGGEKECKEAQKAWSLLNVKF